MVENVSNKHIKTNHNPMNATHTPGPWNIRTARNDEGYGLLICDEDQTILSRMDTWLGKTPEAAMEANARLIAAAPELLAALEAVEARLTKAASAFYVSGKAKDLQAAFDGWKADAHQARAILAKAKSA